MFRLSAVDAINPAFGRMSAMLFRPFRFKTWLKIGFIGWLAGAGAGSFNLNLPSSPGGGTSGSTVGRDVEQAIRTFFSEHLFLIVLIVAFAILIGLGFLYLACRFRFILFDSVLQRDPQIGRGWQRYGRQAHRYLGFMVCFGIASAIVLVLVVGLPAWHAYKNGIFHSNDPFPAILQLLVPIILGVFAFAVVAAVISSLVNDFAVPMLALDDMTLGGAWSMLKEMISAEPWAFAGYLGMKLVLSIAAAIIMAIPTVIILLLLLIPGVNHRDRGRSDREGHGAGRLCAGHRSGGDRGRDRDRVGFAGDDVLVGASGGVLYFVCFLLLWRPLSAAGRAAVAATPTSARPRSATCASAAVARRRACHVSRKL